MDVAPSLRRDPAGVNTCSSTFDGVKPRGLTDDRAAVEAGLSQEWSNGPTEGHVNKLKLLKRQMYGRANVDLLRQRMLRAA